MPGSHQLEILHGRASERSVARYLLPSFLQLTVAFQAVATAPGQWTSNAARRQYLHLPDQPRWAVGPEHWDCHSPVFLRLLGASLHQARTFAQFPNQGHAQVAFGAWALEETFAVAEKVVVVGTVAVPPLFRASADQGIDLWKGAAPAFAAAVATIGLELGLGLDPLGQEPALASASG